MDGSGDLETAMDELDDLGHLFEFGDIGLDDIPAADPANYGEQMHHPQHYSSSHPATHPNTPFRDLGDSMLPGSAVTDFAGQDQMNAMRGVSQRGQHGQHHFLSQPMGHMPASNGYTPDSLYQPAVPQGHAAKDFHYPAQQNYPPAGHIPPTPNSYEMHGRAGPFITQPSQQPHFYRTTLDQQRHQIHKDAQIAFTPMASPAGTPQFPMLPEFTAPGAYFSPLSSPMMLAQNGQHSHLHQGYVSHPTTAPSSAAPSPKEGPGDVDMDDMVLSQDLPNRRKPRRKTATPKSAVSTGKVKSSPAPKAQKRKSTKSTETDLRRAVTSQPSATGLRQIDSSEAESISPEPLSENTMGPPPRPGSASETSAPGSERQANRPQAAGAAATPKSLLQRRPTHPAVNGQISTSPLPQSTGDLGGLDDLALPEAARPPAPAPINTQIASAADEHETPRVSARKTPKLDATSTPSSARLMSATSSPAVGPSPAMSGSTPAAILKDKKDGKGGKGSKKRGSISQGTPKALPKISPSIKPLLPEGSPLHSSTQALLLASKSNYQNLLEGNHLPGVNYPDSLSTGLTSKRTSHKVAEQGRRNRINDALKEMQSLVPKPSPATKAAMKDAADASNEGSTPDGGAADDDKDGEGGSKEENAAKSSNSKAATVELANEYIKKMQIDNARRDAEMDVLRRENEALRKRLAEGGSVDGGGSGDDERMVEA